MNNLKIEDLIVDFDFFDNWEDKYKYIIELGKNYPNPIVDLKLSREKALAAFEKLK